MPATDLLKGAPLFLQKRYGSIRGHVKSVIETDYPKLDIRTVRSEDLEFIQMVAFIYVLQGFFFDGYRAANRTVEILNDLGVKDFSIGSSRFAPGSDAVLMGKKLAEQLLQQITDDSLRELITKATSIGQLIRELF